MKIVVNKDLSCEIKADGMEMKVALKGTLVKDDTVKVEIPKSVKVLTTEEYMSMIMGSENKGITVLLDGDIIDFDVAPVIENSRTLVPFRALLEKLGAEVKWDEATKTVIAKKEGKEIILVIGSDVAKVDGKEVKLDVVPKIVEGRTLIPLRFFSETFGCEVEYDKVGEAAFISIMSPEYKAELEKDMEESEKSTKEEKTDNKKKTEEIKEDKKAEVNK